MVSFQCDGCSDTVKKPKLDSHHPRCGASFTCLDCSTTFHNASEWKVHTQCVSEAQKYQKSLYKGSKDHQGRDQNARPANANANENGKPQANDFAAGKFSRQNQNPTNRRPPPRGNGAAMPFRGGWGRPVRSHASGANDTPLGTPTRTFATPPTLSPAAEQLAAPVQAPETARAEGEANGVTECKKKKKRKSVGIDDAPAVGEGEPERKKAKKKHASDPESSNDVAAAAVVAPASQTPGKEDKKARKKSEKRQADTALATEPVSETRPTKDEEKAAKKARKEEKKRKREDVVVEAGTEAVAEGVEGVSERKKKGKDKKRMGEKEQTGPAVDGVPLESPSLAVDKKAKKKDRAQGPETKTLEVGEAFAFVDTEGERVQKSTKKEKKEKKAHSQPAS